MFAQALPHPAVSAPAISKDVPTTRIGEIHIETRPDLLFPKGGWDVHHHIFERQLPCDVRTDRGLTKF